jgi:hypothetical protein
MFRRKTMTAKGVAKTVNGSDVHLNGDLPAPGDPWERATVRREDVVELLRATCDELKQRGHRR